VQLQELSADFRGALARSSIAVDNYQRAHACPTPPRMTRASQPELRELALPAALRTQRKPDADPDAAIEVRGLEKVNVVRIDRRGKQWAAISTSSLVDPTGEVGAGGYWLHLSRDAGRTWEPPLYLGLRQFLPYVIPPESKLPLLHGRRLRLEVEVNELDLASISFPPIALRATRNAKHVYIELSLDDLERDQDGDGLTDLLEQKLLTNLAAADTDGDGLSDDVDSFPQVSQRAPPYSEAELIEQILGKTMGYQQAAVQEGIDTGGTTRPRPPRARQALADITFLVADPALFGGVSVAGHVVVLSEAEARRQQERYGVFYPLRFPSLWINHERKRALLKWSSSWSGGVLFFEKVDGQWRSREVLRWYT
jgi:hypothetical protein